MSAASRPPVIVLVLLHHRVGKAQHAMVALQPVRPGDDPVHLASQAFQAHGPTLPGTALAWGCPQRYHPYRARAQHQEREIP